MSPSRAARLLVLAPALFAAGCNQPDLSPVRDGLVKQAAVVCAPPPARPAHAPKVRDVPAAELNAALITLCESHRAGHAVASDAAGVLHDALLSDHANVGEARRSTMLVTKAGTACDPSYALVHREVLRAAELAASQNVVAALDRCADVVALARDEDLAGDVTDLMFANTAIQDAVKTCMPIVEHAPKDAAARFHDALVVLRTTFPTGLAAASARDHAEMLLEHFGPVAPSATLGCPRATALATSNKNPLAPPKQLLGAWQASQAAAPPEQTQKYEEAYTLTLGALDRLVSLADVASK